MPKKKLHKKKPVSRKKVIRRKKRIPREKPARPKGPNETPSAQIHQGVAPETASELAIVPENPDDAVVHGGES